MIFHIARKSEWDAAGATGVYAPGSFEAEGFIHCSAAAQVVATADRLFRGEADLVLLAIDEGRLEAELKYEAGVPDRTTELFPHVYGRLNVDAVVRVEKLACDDDGAFAVGPASGR